MVAVRQDKADRQAGIVQIDGQNILLVREDASPENINQALQVPISSPDRYTLNTADVASISAVINAYNRVLIPRTATSSPRQSRQTIKLARQQVQEQPDTARVLVAEIFRPDSRQLDLEAVDVVPMPTLIVAAGEQDSGDVIREIGQLAGLNPQALPRMAQYAVTDEADVGGMATSKAMTISALADAVSDYKSTFELNADTAEYSDAQRWAFTQTIPIWTEGVESETGLVYSPMELAAQLIGQNVVVSRARTHATTDPGSCRCQQVVRG